MKDGIHLPPEAHSALVSLMEQARLRPIQKKRSLWPWLGSAAAAVTVLMMLRPSAEITPSTPEPLDLSDELVWEAFTSGYLELSPEEALQLFPEEEWDELLANF